MASRTVGRLLVAASLAVLGVGLAAQQSEPRIAARDQIVVNVFGVDSLSGKFMIDPDGKFEYPLVGRLQAAGLTPRELGDSISKSLVDKKMLTTLPQVIVDLTQVVNKRVTVTGAVRAQGEVAFAGELKLFDALVRVGMTGPDAGDEILVVRPATDPNKEDEILTVNLRSLTSGNLAQFDIPLQDGDRIIVPEAEKVFIDGYVNSPGAYLVPPGTSVRNALSFAGGISSTGSDKGIKILRRKAGEEKPEELKVELGDIVQPGDTIIIRKRIL